MIDMKTTYMGLELKNPIIAGASGLTSDIYSLKKIEDAGASAVVTKSLFEEQIRLQEMQFEVEAHRNDNLYSEMTNIFPNLEFAGPKEHLMWLKKTKESLSIPVIASLNAVEKETWTEYAAALEETGVDAIELNFYSSPRSSEEQADAVEDEQVEIIGNVKKAVSVPIGVKLSPFYTNPLNFIKRIDDAGAEGLMLFNRLFQPDIDVDKETNTFPLGFSQTVDQRLPLRFTGLLFEKIGADLCAGTGIMEGKDVVKMILAGADAVQVVSTLYKNSVSHIGSMLKEIEDWMTAKGYESLAAFQGNLSRARSKDPWIYTRSQYVKLLMRPGDEILKDII